MSLCHPPAHLTGQNSFPCTTTTFNLPSTFNFNLYNENSHSKLSKKARNQNENAFKIQIMQIQEERVLKFKVQKYYCTLYFQFLNQFLKKNWTRSEQGSNERAISQSKLVVASDCCKNESRSSY